MFLLSGLLLASSIQLSFACIDPPYQFQITDSNAAPSARDHLAYGACFNRLRSIVGNQINQNGLPQSLQRVSRITRSSAASFVQQYSVEGSVNVVTSPISRINGTQQHFQCAIISNNLTHFQITNFRGEWEL